MTTYNYRIVKGVGGNTKDNGQQETIYRNKR